MVLGMPRPRTARTSRVVALVSGTLAVTALLVAPHGGHSTQAVSHARIALAQYPTNAGKIYRWGNAQWADDFVGPVKPMWSINKRRLVRNQHGMLTINATRGSGTVAATVTGRGRQYGRWEARVRAEQYSRGATPYKVVWELIPTGAYHCGAKSIVLAQYPLGGHRAHVYLRNGSKQFTAAKRRDLSAGPFHTYAVEVTRGHIAWFVDTHVIRTERRPAATTGLHYKVRFRMLATKGHRMNPGRMQMDWVRYYTMQRKNARSIDAPQMTATTYRKAC